MKEKLAELLRKRDKAAENTLAGVQLNNQGAEFEKAGNLRRALEKYRAALDLCPEHVGFRVNFAVALLPARAMEPRHRGTTRGGATGSRQQCGKGSIG